MRSLNADVIDLTGDDKDDLQRAIALSLEESNRAFRETGITDEEQAISRWAQHYSLITNMPRNSVANIWPLKKKKKTLHQTSDEYPHLPPTLPRVWWRYIFIYLFVLCNAEFFSVVWWKIKIRSFLYWTVLCRLTLHTDSQALHWEKFTPYAGENKSVQRWKMIW